MLFFYLTITHMRKNLNITNHKVENELVRIIDTFWSTEINFRRIPEHDGSIYVSDTVFDHSQGFDQSYDVKKPSQSSV